MTAAHVHLVTLKPDMNGLSVPSKIYGILAAGRPVIFIGPEQSEAARIVRESQCGVVIRPGDHLSVVKALITYRDDDTLLQEHSRRARAYFDAHCSRPLGTGRFVQLLRGFGEQAAKTSIPLPVYPPASTPSVDKVITW